MADRFRTELDWADVRVFAALARHGSLSATARALSVNHATVARRLAGIEQTLGSKLFERRPSGYELTAAGRNALGLATAMEAAANELGRLEPAAPLSGLVRITATPSLAETFLIPHLRPLRDAHPALDFEVVSDRRPASLPRHQTDIALRLARPQRGDVLARRLVRVGYGFYATHAWRERLAAGHAAHLVGFDEAGAHFPEALWLARRFSDARIGLRANYQTGQIAAARAGFGIALLPHFLAAGDPDLVEVRLKEPPPVRELWMLTRGDVRRTPQLRLVADFLAEVFRRERSRFEGLGARRPQ